MNKKIVDEFHCEYERGRLWEKIRWLGIPIWKFPFDAFIIQEIIFEVCPDFIIETGTGFGGSALFYASIMDLMQQGRVITVDVEDKMKLNNLTTIRLRSRIRQFIGSSTDLSIVNDISAMVKNRVNLVILDSWHSKAHVLEELKLYSRSVTVGSYLIVEDSHVNNHPVPWKWKEGPYEAIMEFLYFNKNFKIDKDREKLELTFNPCGFLRRIK